MLKVSGVRRLSLVVGCCLVGGVACRSIAPAGPSRTAPPEPVLSLLDADSAVFEAVVRGQLAGTDDAYPYRLPRFRYDARPYVYIAEYPDTFAGVEGSSPSLSFPRASESESEMAAVIQTRKRILRMSGVREGPVVVYTQCAGAGIPVPPPPRVRTRGAKPRDVHAGCPKAVEYYLTVGLPSRGQPPGLRNARDTRGRPVRLRGDVWTALVDEIAIGPEGWKRSQYAWLFRNNSGRLELAHTVLTGAAQ